MTAEVSEDWFCTDCGRGPIQGDVWIFGEEVWLESHAPSCGGTDDPSLRTSPRKYGKLG